MGMISKVIVIALWSLMVAVSVKASDVPLSPNYNVIVISIDALQARHLKSYGYHLSTTPNLDRFLSKSYLFKNTVTPAPWTVPAHMSIFTSLNPSEHKVVNMFSELESTGTPRKAVTANLKALSPSAVTLAEILKKNGFRTAGFTGDAGINKAFGHSEGFDVFYDETILGGFNTSQPMALEWLDKNRDKRFFLFLHGYDVHGQYAPTGGFDYRYVKKPYGGKYTGSKNEEAELREQALADIDPKLSDEDIAFWRAIYDEKIARADEQFGRALEYFEKNGFMENSIIVVLSDHGTAFFEHGKFDHGHSLYGELLDVLLAIHVPGQEKGTAIGSLVSTLDVTPTILNMLKIKDPAMAAMKGIDLSPSIKGKDISRAVFSETDFRLYTHKRGIRTPDGWKMILTMESMGRELYNLNTDSGEKVNLAAKEPKIAYELEQKIYKHLREMKASEGPWAIGCPPDYGFLCNPLPNPYTERETLKTPLNKPNIVIIDIDSLRAQQMKVDGYGKNPAPFLDSLFQQGVMFNNTITPAYLGFQTDAAILSGLYPSQNNVMTCLTPINEKLNLLPYVLKLNGYNTASFGSSSLWPGFNYAGQFDEYNFNRNPDNLADTKSSVAEWMTSTKRPFFVFWHVHDAQLPFMKPAERFFGEEYSGTFLDDKKWNLVNQANIEACAADTGNPGKNVPKFTELNETDARYLRAAYDTGIQYVDNQLRSFFAGIRDKEFYKNTVFIISSGHGVDIKEHGLLFRRDLYDENIRVPLALIGLPVGHRIIDEAVSSLDIMPTVMEIAGGIMPEYVEGKSLVPLINGKSLNRDLYTERPPFDEYAMRRGKWKYIIRNPAKKDSRVFADIIEGRFMKNIASGDIYAGNELYDLSMDRLEKINLAGKGFPVESEMRDELDKFRVKMRRAREYNDRMGKGLPAGGKLIPYP